MRVKNQPLINPYQSAANQNTGENVFSGLKLFVPVCQVQ